MSNGSAGKRIPELDGIRGWAILLVLVWHYLVLPLMSSPYAPLRSVAGWGILTWSGVDLFFVLSGFLIGGILIDAKGAENFFQTFYIRRVFRILPIYVAVCVAYPAIAAVPRVKAVLGGAMPWYVYFTFTHNFWLAHHPWNTYLDGSWSLAVEEQFYLTLPALVYVTAREHLAKVIAFIVVASAIWRAVLYLHYYPAWGSAAYTLMICRADALMVGVLGALVMRNPEARKLFEAKKNLVNAAAVVLLAGVCLLSYKRWTMLSAVMSTVGYTWLAGFYVTLLLVTVTRKRGLLSQIFSMGWLRWLGTLAYCLYLVHGTTRQLAYAAFHRPPRLLMWSDLVPGAIGLGAALLISHLSWKYFESRLVQFGHKFTYRKRWQAAVTAPDAVPLAQTAASGGE